MSDSLADTTQLGGTPNSPDSPTGGPHDRGPVTRDVAAGGLDPVDANVLYADHITIRFGGLVAVNDV